MTKKRRQKPGWWGFYKLIIVIISLFGIMFACADPLIGIGIIIFSILLWGTQHRREKTWIEEQRHQETLQAMYQNPNNQPPIPPKY